MSNDLSNNEPKNFRVLVTGSRTWLGWDTIRNALSGIAGQHKEGTVTLVVGDARGADFMAKYIVNNDGNPEMGIDSRYLNWNIEQHNAEWDIFGKRAGYLRNQAMVDSGIDVALAFIRNDSRGATMCAKLAQEREVKTIIFRESGEDVAYVPADDNMAALLADESAK